MNKDIELVNIIKIRKLQYLGHIMRNESRYAILSSHFARKKEALAEEENHGFIN